MRKLGSGVYGRLKSYDTALQGGVEGVTPLLIRTVFAGDPSTAAPALAHYIIAANDHLGGAAHQAVSAGRGAMADLHPMTTELAALRLRLGEIGRAGRHFDFAPDETVRADMARTFRSRRPAELPRRGWTWRPGSTARKSAANGAARWCRPAASRWRILKRRCPGRFTVRVVPDASPERPGRRRGGRARSRSRRSTGRAERARSSTLGGYVLEHLALEIDPFPRKPGAVFEPPQTAEIISPFASLRNLKP